MPFQFQLAVSPFYNIKLLEILTQIELDTDLTLCLDAGDANSYTSGMKWLDVSGGGYDFFRGQGDGSGQAPTFNGTTGNNSSSEFFSCDSGTDDLFTYDSTNETWMNAMHKDSAAFTIATWVRFDAFKSLNRSLIWDSASSTTGIELAAAAGTSTSSLTLHVFNASSNVFSATAAATFEDDKWCFLGVSVDEASDSIIFVTNGTSESDSCTYSSPSSGSSTHSTELFSDSDVDVAALAAWDSALSASDLAAIYQNTRAKFAV